MQLNLALVTDNQNVYANHFVCFINELQNFVSFMRLLISELFLMNNWLNVLL